MKKSTKKNVIIKAEPSKQTVAFSVFAGVLFFGAVYLTVFSAVSESLPYLFGVLPGAAFAAIFPIFRKNKIAFWSILGIALVYTVLCASVGFSPFVNGILNFANNVVRTANERMHWGLASFEAQPSAAGDFLFCSVMSVWLALGVSALGGHVRVLVSVTAVLLLAWLCLGLCPAWYAVVLLAVATVALLASERGFSPKAAIVCFICAVIVCGVAAPCFLYAGSPQVRDFRSAIVYSAENTFFGKDDLPEGRLSDADRMRTSNKVRLEVTLTAQVRTLYLKGYVGSRLEGNVFKPTDKNAYVQNDYQGLIDYVAQGGLPALQYARYAELNGHEERHEIAVVNKSANAKYVYMPYTAGTYSAGAPYYDMNLRSNLFTPKRYSFHVFGGDKSCERVTQAHWLLEGSTRTEAMNAYLALEGAYRSFVYDEYCKIDSREKNLIVSALGGSASSINTAAQLIRRYFTDHYVYSGKIDGAGDDFLANFYGGAIRNANAAYFAAAATYAFRAYGFPARYVEGYLVNPIGGTENVITVTGKSSHAWTEVYFDGIGWLPIDVTPTFYSEEDPDAPVDPDDPNIPPVDPEDPDLDPNPPDKPVDPVDPNPKPSVPEDPQERNLYYVLKALVPVLAVLLGVTVAVLFVVVRRLLILGRKQKRLESNGESFGRAAYSVMERDLKPFGGFSPQTLQRFGIAEGAYERFMQLTEKCVYGGYELNENERNYMLYIIKDTAEAIMKSGGRFRSLWYKYFNCIGL